MGALLTTIRPSFSASSLWPSRIRVETPPCAYSPLHLLLSSDKSIRLNTFLELKMENERLQARLQAAKAKAENIKLSPMIPSSLDSSASSPSAVSSPTQPSYAQSGPTFTYSYSTHGPRSASSEAGSYKPYDTPLAGPSSAFAQVQEDDADVSGDPSLPRKKVSISLLAYT